MADVAPETPEACEEAAIQAIEHNKTSNAVVFSNLAISKAITRLTEVVIRREK